jgi:DNA-binding FadR family transcriptional regulator
MHQPCRCDARAAFKPAVAREAALHASTSEIAHLALLSKRSRNCASWREYEVLDSDFHLGIALFDQLKQIRRMVSFGTAQRSGTRPPETHPSFGEHEDIITAIAARDPEAADSAMRRHLLSVSARL